MTLELGFPRPCLKKIALENINDAAGPQWVRQLRQRVRVLDPLGISKGTLMSKRVWSTAGRNQCVKYSSGKFQESSSQS